MMRAIVVAATLPAAGGCTLALTAAAEDTIPVRAVVRTALGCGPYESHDSSEYVLPYQVGREYVVIQGNCTSGTHHASTAYLHAYDIDLGMGDTIVAARGGVVVLAVDRHADGTRLAGRENEVHVLHHDGSLGRYIHMMRGGALVSIGDTVAQGQVIGRAGDSGYSFGPHLHFDVAECGEHHCRTYPVTFRNTRAQPAGLETNQRYRALPIAGHERESHSVRSRS